MKNYICTSEGFLKSAGFSQEKQEFMIEYTNKVRDAQAFNTKAATKFMENHDVKGFIWKPYEQEPVRNMYVVRKNRIYGFNENEKNSVEEWILEKAVMVNESDIVYLTSKSNRGINQDVMTFEKAKTKTIELNLELLRDINEKVKDLTHQKESIK